MTQLARIPKSAYVPEKASYSDLKFEHGAHGKRFRTGITDRPTAPVAPEHPQTRAPDPMLEIIWQSKIHLVTTTEFQDNAATYLEILRHECLDLLDLVSFNKRVYKEWAYPDGWIDGAVAGTVRGVASIKSWFDEVKNAPKPDPLLFDDLTKRLNDIAARQAKSDLSYPMIHQIGLDLALVREDLARLNHKVALFRDNAIEAAESTTKGLETVESASFQVLAIVPTLTLMDPLRETAYKIGLIMTRAGARSLGAWAANTSVTSQLFGVLKEDVPPLICDLLTGKLNRLLTASGTTGLTREFTVFIIQQEIEFLSDLTMMMIHNDGKISQDDLTELGKKRLASAIAKLLSVCFGGRPEDEAKKKWANSLIESTMNTLYRDVMAARDTAKSQNREVWQVFLNELPWTIVKIIQGTVIGVMSRNAATAQHVAEREGVQHTTTEEAHAYVRDQPKSAIFSGKFIALADRKARNKAPLPPLTTDGYKEWHARTNLHPDIAGPVRRYAHDMDEILAFREPSSSMAEHAMEFAKRPKPLFIKAKSAKTGPNAGLVVRPSAESHPDLADANKYWHKSTESLQKNGCLVRADGVVFHPDMLTDHGNATGQAARGQAASRVLVQLQAAGAFDLLEIHSPGTPGHAAVQAALAARKFTQKELDDALALTNSASIGYYPDIDMSEVVDARTGDRKALGAGNETGDKLAYARRNQDNLDKAINVNHDIQSIPGEYRGPDGQPRVASKKESAHHQNLIQHGGDYEYWDPAGGAIIVVFPDGSFRRLSSSQPQTADKATHEQDIRQQYEAALQDYLKSNYKQFTNRATGATVDSHNDLTNWAEASGKGQRINTQALARVRSRWSNVRDIQPRGDEQAALEHIDASLLHRRLAHPALNITAFNKVFAAPELASLAQKLDNMGCTLGIDKDQKTIVVATGANSTVGKALGKLARCTVDLQLRTRNVTLYYEIYTSLRPHTSDHIRDRLGGKETGTNNLDAYRSLLSSVTPPEKNQLYTFCLDGFLDTFTPNPDTKEYGPVVGFQLMDVWEHTRSRVLAEKPCQIGDRPVVVFTAGLAVVPRSTSFRN